MQTDSPNLPSCPFRGLDAFSENDRDYFFGREEDATTIGANVLTSPLTVLYGASGVGKSSTVMAGVIPMLRGQRNVTIVLFRSWQQPDLIPTLNQAVDDAVFDRVGLHSDTSGGFDLCVASAVAVTNAPVVILFDQFEEFLLYHGSPSETGAAFDLQFARLVNRPDAPVSFLISIREDWLARLDRFQRHIPNLLSNVIRLDHLDYEGARRATTKPIEHYNDVLRLSDPTSTPYAIEPELVEVILDQVTTASGLRAGEVAGEFATADDAARIETPFLQMILIALWKAEQSSSSRLLRVSTLEHLGGAAHIVHSYVGGVVSQLSRDQQEICARMFDRLVTPSASKIAHSAQDLAEFAQVSPAAIGAVLKELTKNRILRQVVSPSVTCYEIFHDVLARPILEWRTRYIRARRARISTRRRIAASTIVAILIVISGGLYASHWLEDKRHKDADKLLGDARKASGETAIAKFNEAFEKYAASDDKKEVPAVDDAVIEAAGHLTGNDALRMWEVADKVAQTLPHHTRALTEIGNLRLAQTPKNITGARQAAQQAATYAAQLKTPSPRLWFRLGVLRMNLGDQAGALGAFKLACAKSNSSDHDIKADSYYNMGLLSYRDKPAVAIAEFENALKHQRVGDGRNTLSTLNVLAQLHRRLKNEEEARRYEKEVTEALDKVLGNKLLADADIEIARQLQ